MTETSTGILVSKYAPLVYAVANRMDYGHYKLERDDLVQYGMIGLLLALPKIQWDCNPESYLYGRIRYAIIDGLRAEGAMKPRSLKKMTEYYTTAVEDVDEMI